MPESISYAKSKAFALRIIRLAEYLQKEHHAFALSDQIMRSGTSIGANIAESRCAQSRPDFLSKIYIALKEASETQYWLDLLYSANYITEPQFQSLITDCNELVALLQSTTKTLNPK